MRKFVHVRRCSQDYHAVKGGATLRDRGMAAELREMIHSNRMVVPTSLRSILDPNEYPKLEWYLNSIVHEKDDFPTYSISLQKGTFPYDPVKTEALLAWAYQNAPGYRKQTWSGS